MIVNKSNTTIHAPIHLPPTPTHHPKMQAYSVYDREVGYCQGSPFITGMLLMQQVRSQSAAVTSVITMMSLSHYC